MVPRKHKLVGPAIPERLRDIASPPNQLYVSSDLEPLLKHPVLAVVGSRKMSAYGRAVTEQLIPEVVRAGVVIVSGLALGLDACAHRAALGAGGLAIAVLPTSLDNIQPRTNARLADQIMEQGGVLLSEYAPGSPIHRNYFVARNRLVTGLADAVLIPEAAEKSGTMHTAVYARKQDKPLLVVPGPINSPLSAGPNSLLKAGAQAVTEAADILRVLGVSATAAHQLSLIEMPDAEKSILELVEQGISDGNELQRQAKLAPDNFNQAITMLELAGHIKNRGNNQWSL